MVGFLCCCVMSPSLGLNLLFHLKKKDLSACLWSLLLVSIKWGNPDNPFSFLRFSFSSLGNFQLPFIPSMWSLANVSWSAVRFSQKWFKSVHSISHLKQVWKLYRNLFSDTITDIFHQPLKPCLHWDG